MLTRERHSRWILLALPLVALLATWALWSPAGRRASVSPGAAARAAEIPPADPRSEPFDRGRASLLGAPPAPEPEPQEGDAPGLRAIFLRIAAAEERIVASARVSGEPDAAPVADVEAAMSLLLADAASLEDVLTWLRPHSDGSRRLEDREEYGAIRALYWWMVISAGRGEARAVVLRILERLPELHPACRAFLVDNLVLAASDGRKVLDAQYLDTILDLRRRHPDLAELYSELLTGLGESLTPEERSSFFALFAAEDSDPALVGVTLRNLLEGVQVEFALLLARELYDDEGTSIETRKAILDAVAAHADVFAATDFLAGRAQGSEVPIGTWLELGMRDGAEVALETAYLDLAQRSADPKAREAVVMAMRSASPGVLLSIARTDPDPRVIGQALLTVATPENFRSDPQLAANILGLIDEALRLRPGEVRAVDFLHVVSSVARASSRGGRNDSLERAVAILRDIALDRSVVPGQRQNALEALKPLIPAEQWIALRADF